MSRATSEPPRASDTVTNLHTGETMTFLGVRRGERGDALVVRTALPPGAKGPPVHVHPHQVEEGTVLSGRVAVRVDGRTTEHGAGEGVTFPPGSAHTWWNAGDEVLVVEGRLTPPLHFEAFIREMFAAMNAGRDGRPSPFAAMALLASYPDDQRLPGVPGWVQRRVVPILARLGGQRARRPSSGAAAPNSRS